MAPDRFGGEHRIDRIRLFSHPVENIPQHLLDTRIPFVELHIGRAEIRLQMVQLRDDAAFQLAHRQLQPVLPLLCQLQQHLRFPGAEIAPLAPWAAG